MGGTTTEDAKSPLPGRDPVVSARRIGEAVADAAPGRVRLLLVDPDEVAGRQLQRQLHEFGAGFEVAVAGRLSTALAHLATSPTDSVLADLSLPDSNGLETLARLRAGASSELPILVLAGREDEELALEALGAGASDYLLKGRASRDLVARAVQYAIERERLLVAERESRRDAEAARSSALRTQRALEASEKRRRSLLGSMLRAEEAERQRIAVELHDDTVQVMVAALVGMDACQATIDRDDPGGAVESMARARATLSEAVDRVRRMSFELRPPLLDAQGLGPAVTDLVDEVAAECDLERRVDVSLRRYSPEIEILTYRTIRELMANVRKHARAQRVELDLHEERSAVVCTLTDDGVGFDANGIERATGRLGMRLHLGLDATIERVRVAGGTFSIESAAGGGTSVRFAIPIHRQGDVRAS
ncbi:MAG TPA: response regulator [Gaiellales bacterium]|nr:response regulator [Gaiellales bacterium]